MVGYRTEPRTWPAASGCGRDQGAQGRLGPRDRAGEGRARPDPLGLKAGVADPAGPPSAAGRPPGAASGCARASGNAVGQAVQVRLAGVRRRDAPADLAGAVAPRAPGGARLELAFGDLIDRLEPDVVHAHDMHVIGVATRAAGRAKLRGKDLKVVYDAHEYVAGLVAVRRPRDAGVHRGLGQPRARVHRRRRPGHHRQPGDRRPAEDASTSSRRADRDHEHAEACRGSVEVGPTSAARSGWPPTSRCWSTAVASPGAWDRDRRSRRWSELPGVHLAVGVSRAVGERRGPRPLQAWRCSWRCEDRMHYLDPVEPHEVVAFLRTADVGLIPILRYPSHEMALPNKLFEYSFARAAGGRQRHAEHEGVRRPHRDRRGLRAAADAHDLAAKVKLGARRPGQLPRAAGGPGVPAGSVLGRAGDQAARALHRRCSAGQQMDRSRGRAARCAPGGGC